LKQKEYDLNEDFKCASCGDPITGDDYDDPQDSQCPECENHLCRVCACTPWNKPEDNWRPS